MKIVRTSWFPFEGYLAINLFGVLFVRGKKPLSERVIRHEEIHTAQMKEMAYIFFYLWYCVEYVIVRFMHRTQKGAYKDVSFEEEAYINEVDAEYLKKREPYAWAKYLKVSNRD